MTAGRGYEGTTGGEPTPENPYAGLNGNQPPQPTHDEAFMPKDDPAESVTPEAVQVPAIDDGATSPVVPAEPFSVPAAPAPEEPFRPAEPFGAQAPAEPFVPGEPFAAQAPVEPFAPAEPIVPNAPEGTPAAANPFAPKDPAVAPAASEPAAQSAPSTPFAPKESQATSPAQAATTSWTPSGASQAGPAAATSLSGQPAWAPAASQSATEPRTSLPGQPAWAPAEPQSNQWQAPSGDSSKSDMKKVLALGFGGIVALGALIGGIWALSGNGGEEPTAGPSTSTSTPSSGAADLTKPLPAGTYVVGKDLPAGLYVLQTEDAKRGGSIRAYIDQSGQDDTIGSQYFRGNYHVQLEDGVTIELDNVTLWLPDKAPKVDPGATEGEFRVGEDIEPGIYAITASGTNGATYTTRSDAGLHYESQMVSEYDLTAGYVELDAGDYIAISDAVLTPIDKAPKITLGERTMVKVGRDIDPGRYVAKNIYDEGYTKVHILSDLRKPDYTGLSAFEGAIYVDLEDGKFVSLRNVTLVPEADAPARTPGDNVGMFLVGKDIEPGTYLYTLRTVPKYGTTLKIANSPELFDDYVNHLRADIESQVYLTVKAGQYIMIDDKGTLEKEADAKPVTENKGMLKVGKDIPAGTYELAPNPGQTLKYFVYKDATFEKNSIITSDYATRATKVTVKDGEYLSVHNGEVKR